MVLSEGTCIAAAVLQHTYLVYRTGFRGGWDGTIGWEGMG